MAKETKKRQAPTVHTWDTSKATSTRTGPDRSWKSLIDPSAQQRGKATMKFWVTNAGDMVYIQTRVGKILCPDNSAQSKSKAETTSSVNDYAGCVHVFMSQQASRQEPKARTTSLFQNPHIADSTINERVVAHPRHLCCCYLTLHFSSTICCHGSAQRGRTLPRPGQKWLSPLFSGGFAEGRSVLFLLAFVPTFRRDTYFVDELVIIRPPNGCPLSTLLSWTAPTQEIQFSPTTKKVDVGKCRATNFDSEVFISHTWPPNRFIPKFSLKINIRYPWDLYIGPYETVWCSLMTHVEL